MIYLYSSSSTFYIVYASLSWHESFLSRPSCLICSSKMLLQSFRCPVYFPCAYASLCSSQNSIYAMPSGIRFITPIKQMLLVTRFILMLLSGRVQSLFGFPSSLVLLFSLGLPKYQPRTATITMIMQMDTTKPKPII